MMLKQKVGLCLAFLTIFPFVWSFDSSVVSTIDYVIENVFMPSYNTGFGLAIVKVDESGVPDVLTKGYGFKNLENQLRADNRTLFAIGSITKSFTATIVVKTLTEKYPELGEGVLDVPIRLLLPSINFTLSDRFRSESTSFRDLLSHRSCIDPGFIGFVLRTYQNKEEFLYRVRYAEELCPFRADFVYNNVAYLMAGEIIAQIANSTFEVMLTDFLRELEMTHTIIIRDSDDYNDIPNMSRCYYSDNGVTKRYNFELLKWIAISAAPGGILSTSEDMLKYMLFHINNGKVGDKQIISELFKKRHFQFGVAIKYLRKASALQPGGLFPKTKPDDIIQGVTSYGLGLNSGVLDGWEEISHSGSLPPYTSYLTMYPALKLGIYTVANGPKRMPDPRYLHTLIYDIIEKGLRKDGINAKPVFSNRSWPLPFIPDSKPKTKLSGLKKTIDSDDIVGLYGNGLEGEFVITSSDGILYIQFGVWGTGTLIPISESIYRIEWISDIIQFFTFVGFKEQTIDFSQENVALLTSLSEDTEEKITTVFHKDLTLDKLPSQPWASDSCGPNN